MELAGVDVEHRDQLPGGYVDAIVLQQAACRQRADLYREQRMRRAVGRVGETEVRRREDIDRVFERGHGVVRTDRRVVQRGHLDGHRARRCIEIDAAIRHPARVLHLEREECIACTVRVRRRREFKISRIDVRNRHGLDSGHRAAVERKNTRRGQRGYADVCQRVGAPCACGIRRIGEAEVRRGERIGRVFEGRHGMVGSSGRVVDRGDIHRQRAWSRIEIDAADCYTAIILYLERE